MGAFSHTYSESGHWERVCTYSTDADGNRTESCHDEYECDSRSHSQWKSPEQIAQSARVIRSGLQTTVFEKPFSEMHLPTADTNRFNNLHSKIAKAYLTLAQSKGFFVSNFENILEEINQAGDSDFYFDPSCIYGYFNPPPWKPRRQAGSINNHSKNLAEVYNVRDRLVEAQPVIQNILYGLAQNMPLEEKMLAAGDYSIDIHRVLGIPGKGHLRQSEITTISWIAAAVGAAAGAGSVFAFYKNRFDGLYYREMRRTRHRF